MRQQDQALHTELSAERILASYGRQLDSAGWKPLDASHEVAKGSWSKATAPDTAQDVTLTVTKADIPGCYEIELRTSTRGQKR